MKYILVAVSLVLAPICALAEEIPRYEVFTALKSIQDPTTAIPEIFKPIEKDMRSYRVARQQYEDQVNLAIQTVVDIGGRSPKTSADLDMVAKDIDARSKQIARLFIYRKELVTHMTATPKGKILWQSVVEANPEYDDALTATFDVRFNDAVLQLLSHARDAYITLAQNTTPFIPLNGVFVFSTETQSNVYLHFLATLRTDMRAIVTAERDRYDFLLRRPNASNIYSYEYRADMGNKLKDKNMQLENWARTVPVVNVEYSPLKFFLAVQRTLNTDPALATAARNVQQIQTEQHWNNSFAQTDFDSLSALQKAIARARTVTATVEAYEQTKSAIMQKLNKELRAQYNTHRAVIEASDTEFKNTYEPAMAGLYLRAVLAYHIQAMTLVQPCLGLSAKKRCTVKVKDGITITVTDKSAQKKLDALKKSFLKVYQSEYDTYKHKEVPIVGA